jgi:hypothetical protein
LQNFNLWPAGASRNLMRWATVEEALGLEWDPEYRGRHDLPEASVGSVLSF